MSMKQKIKNGALCVALAGADLLGVASYKGQHENLVGGYAHDVLIPTSLYFLLGTRDRIKSKLGKATSIFLGCSAFEMAQGLGLYHGTFDPNDFIAYASGTVLALGIDALTSRKNQKSLETN